MTRSAEPTERVGRLEESLTRERSYVLKGRRELPYAWAQLMGRIPWQWLVTLTFDPKRVFPISQDYAQREAVGWCHIVQYTYRRRAGWFVATERHRSGRYHAHVLLVGAAKDLHSATEVWRERNGKVDTRPVT